jgi:DNA-binding MarR family transcriptional regulator
MHTGTVDVDYPQLLSIRTALRRFLRWSEDAAEAEGVSSAQYQLLVVVKGMSDESAPSIGQIAEQLLLRHHSASELVHRAEESGLVRTRPEELARLAPLIAGLVR